MSDEAYWADLRPILRDMADRIARIEQFLSASALPAPSSGPSSSGRSSSGRSSSGASSAGAGGSGEVFDSVPTSFGAPPAFNAPPVFSASDQIAAASAGISPFGPPQPGVVPDDILLLARSGKKIQAINEYRKRTGISLKQAKNIIDQASRGY